MTIAFRAGSATTAGDASGGNLTINKGAGVADGDVLVINLYREGGTWTPPDASWHQVGTDQADHNGSGDFLALAGTQGFVELPPQAEPFPEGFIAQLYRW